MMRFIRWFFVTLFPPVFAVAIVLWASRESPPVEMQGMYFIGTYVDLTQKNEFSIRIAGIKNRDCPVVVKEELIDSHGESHLLPLRIGVVNTTGPFDSTIKYKIPEASEFPDGLTTFRSVAVYSPDYLNLCFRTYTIGPPQRPDVRFWVGHTPPPWLTRR